MYSNVNVVNRLRPHSNLAGLAVITLELGIKAHGTESVPLNHTAWKNRVGNARMFIPWPCARPLHVRACVVFQEFPLAGAVSPLPLCPLDSLLFLHGSEQLLRTGLRHGPSLAWFPVVYNKGWWEKVLKGLSWWERENFSNPATWIMNVFIYWFVNTFSSSQNQELL